MTGVELEVGTPVTVVAGLAQGNVGHVLGWYLDTGDVVVGTSDGRVTCFPEGHVAPLAD